MADRLGAVAATTLVVNGEQDLPGYREIGEIVHRGVPRAERREVSGAGHFVSLEQPTAFNRLADRFLDRVDRSPTTDRHHRSGPTAASDRARS
ncbi:alpha/beta fold hydrolase [Phytohabitans flavus]|uniref:alpha/beta fold hydrolase n=1 Tax=Phytohabitans flavus TaxID=1076124 RepID=UPI00362BA492